MMKLFGGVGVGLVIGVIVALGNPANAGLLSSLGTSDWVTKSSNKYKVEAYGFDIRVYDWERSDGKICTVAFSEAGPVGLDCE